MVERKLLYYLPIAKILSGQSFAGLSLKYRVGGCIKKVDGYRYVRMWDKITRAIRRTSWSKLKLPCKRFETSLVSCNVIFRHFENCF